VLPPSGQLFKEYREELKSLLSGILQIRSMFWNQISSFKDHVYSILIVEMKSERCYFWKRSFENQASSIKDPTHTIKCSPLIALYFENINDSL